MKLTWTIFMKDFRRVWVPWLLWLALAIADISLASLILRGSEVNQATQFENEAYRVLVHCAFIVLGYILAAWLVQLDSPANAESEWMNRPISGMRLLGGKLLGVLLLIVAPMLLIDSIWWIYCDLLRSQIPGVALETLTFGASIAFLGVFLSSASRDWLCFLILTIALLGFGILAVFSGWPFLEPFLEAALSYGRAGESFHILRTELNWLVLAGLFASMCVQYAYRQLGRTIGVVLIGLLVTVLVSRMIEPEAAEVWPEDQPTVMPQVTKPVPDGVRLKVTSARFFDDPRHPRRIILKMSMLNGSRWPLSLNVRLDGTQSGEMYQSLAFDGMVNINGRNHPVHSQWSANIAETFVTYVPRGIVGYTPAEVDFGPRINLPRSVAALAIEGPTSIHGTFYLRKLVANVGTKLPLVVGKSACFWGSSISIVKAAIHPTDSEPNSGGSWKAFSLVNIVGPSSINWSDHYSNGDIGGYVFWNPSMGEAAYAAESNLAFAYVHGVRLERGMFVADIPFSTKCDTLEKAQAWLDGAQLVWVGYGPSEFYHVQVDVPDLKINVRRD